MGYEGLQKQTLEVRIGGGLDQHNEPFLVDAPSLLGSDNTRVSKDGSVGKRNGAQLGATSGLPTATGTPPVCVIDQGGSLAMHHAEGTYQLDETRSNWRKTNELAPRVSKVLVDSLIRGNENCKFIDFAVSGDLICVVWYSGNDEAVQYAFVNASTLAVIAGPREHSFPNLSYWPRILAFDAVGAVPSKFVLTGINGDTGGSVYASFYTVSAGNYAFGSPVLVGTSSPGSGSFSVAKFYDICPSSTPSRWTLCYPNNGNTIVRDMDSSGSVVLSKTITGFQARCVFLNAPLSSIVCMGGTAASMAYTGHLARFNSDYSSSPVTYSVHTPSSETKAVTVACEAIDGRMVVWTDNEIVRVNAAYAKTAEGVNLFTPISKAHYIYPAQSTDECVCFQYAEGSAGVTSPMVTASGKLLAGYWNRCLYRRVGINGEIPDSLYPGEIRPRHLSSADFVGRRLFNISPVTGSRGFQIDIVRSSLVIPGTLRTVSANGVSMTASGCGLTCFDTQQHAELTPSNPTFSVGLDTALDLGIALWPIGYLNEAGPGHERMNVGFVYVWTDARGNKHRSGMSTSSVAQTDVILGAGFFGNNVAGATPYYAVKFTFNKPSWNAVNGDRFTQLEIEVYLGDPAYGNERMYYQRTAEPKSVDDRSFYVSMSWGGAFVDLDHVFSATGPSVLETGGAPLYGAAVGELEPTQLPALLDVCSTQSRLWALSAEDRFSVWPSKPVVAGVAPQFSTDLVTTIPSDGGPCVAVAALDDKVVVFKQNRIFVLFGDPGLADGSQSSLQPARLISSDVGADSPASVVEGPFGVCFNSSRGIMLLDRGLALTPIGERVLDSTSGLVVTSGTLVAAETEVRWTLDSTGYSLATSTAVVWNYKHNVWHSYSSFPTACATVWNGDFARFGANGLPYIETPGTWTAADTANSVLTTAWIRPGGLQGFMRLWRILLIGRWYTGWLRVEIGYNYEDDWKESRQWTATELTSFATRGQRIQVRIAPSEQKIESFRLRITERATVTQPEGASDTGRGFEWVAIQLEAGIKRGGFKQLVAAAKR